MESVNPIGPRSFGDESFCSGFSFHGPASPEATKVMVDTVIAMIGMKPIFDKTIYTWTEDGVGFIYIQPLYESCVVVDVWPCHTGGYLFVISCKPYDPDVVAKVLHDLGYTTIFHDKIRLFL